MAAKIVTTVSKKIPIAGLDFSSVSASCTVEAEITDLAAVPAQARALYAQAEAAVDEQLRLVAPAPAHATHVQQPPAGNYRPGPNPSPRSSSPAPAGRSGRGMPRASASQLKLIERLIDGDGQRAADICVQHGVRSLPELTIRAASTVSDTLRAETPA
jgi:hypothetical protein